MTARADIRYELRAPTAAEYGDLRADAGWHAIAPERSAAGLAASLAGVVALDGDTVVGMGRVVGDGAVYFHIHDVVVRSTHRSLGIGSGIVDRLMAYLDTAAPAGAGVYIGLFTSAPLEGFYGRVGFHRFSPEIPVMNIRR